MTTTSITRIEMLDRIGVAGSDERWLAQVGGDLRVVWLQYGNDGVALQMLDEINSFWIGLEHPRVSRILFREHRGDRLLYVVDDDRGPTLAAATAQLAEADREPWAISQVIAIAGALDAMAGHGGGVNVYRDLTPEHLFVDATGRARLRARIDSLREIKTRPARIHWMSPEQCRGRALTPASDVFALASNLAYVLTGEPPFTADDDRALLERIVRGPPPVVPTRAAGLDRVLARAFASDPRARYRTPLELATELYECIPDAGDYDAVVSDRIAAWWPEAPDALGDAEPITRPCVDVWEALPPDPTAACEARRCTGCGHAVVRTRGGTLVPLAGLACSR